MVAKVFLDIKIGNVAEFNDAQARFEKVNSWLKQWYTTYGFSSDHASKLNSEEKETLRDILASDPTATAEYWLIDAPTPLSGGKMVFELFEKECPKTCENFATLCKGGKVGKSSKKELYYKNTSMFRLATDFMVQGGDVTRGRKDDCISEDMIYISY
jgi:hypothetical protein